MNHLGKVRRGIRGHPSYFVGREAERERLGQAILRRESMLILGVPGSGKTALIAALHPKS